MQTLSAETSAPETSNGPIAASTLSMICADIVEIAPRIGAEYARRKAESAIDRQNAARCAAVLYCAGFNTTGDGDKVVKALAKGIRVSEGLAPAVRAYIKKIGAALSRLTDDVEG